MENQPELAEGLMGKRVSTTENHNYHFYDYNPFLRHPIDNCTPKLGNPIE